MFDVDKEMGGKAATEKELKYLTFVLANAEYGVDILKVKEIIGIIPITSLPQTPRFVKGVVNLRDTVIPIFDLRLKFEMEGVQYTKRTCIIVIEMRAKGRTVLMGVIVDSVSDVLSIRKEEIEDMAAVHGAVDSEYILGMAKTADGIKILLDIDKVLNGGGDQVGKAA